MPFGSTLTKKPSRRLLIPAGVGAVLATSLLVLTNLTTASGAVQTATTSGARPAAVHASAPAAIPTVHRTATLIERTASTRQGRIHAATSHVTATRPAGTHPAGTHRAATHRRARPTTHHAAAPPASAATTTTTAGATTAAGYGCADALSYLESHAAAGFTFECPAYALGHQAMTCIDVAGVCAGEHLIAINDPCPAAYMNEASNSKVLEGLSSAPIDPYGSCS